MVEIAIGVVIWVGAFLTGWYAREKYAERVLNRFLSQAEENVKERVMKDMIPVHIEQHNGHYYVYNGNDKSFMAQGETRKALEEMLEEKYPGKKFAAKEDNLAEVGFVNASDTK